MREVLFDDDGRFDAIDAGKVYINEYYCRFGAFDLKDQVGCVVVCADADKTRGPVNQLKIPVTEQVIIFKEGHSNVVRHGGRFYDCLSGNFNSIRVPSCGRELIWRCAWISLERNFILFRPLPCKEGSDRVKPVPSSD